MSETTTKPIYRMSSAGKCPRALSAERLNYESAPKPLWLGRAAEEGNWHEARIKLQLKNDGIAIYGEQREIVIDLPSLRLVGHIDGIASSNGKEMLLEIKTMSQFEFDRWMREWFNGFFEYEAQLKCYMHALGLAQARYIVKNRNSGYTDTRTIDYGDIVSFEAIQERLELVEYHVQRQELCNIDFDPQSIQCRRCDYKQLCVPEVKEIGSIEEAELMSASMKVREGKKLIKQGEAIYDEGKITFEAHAQNTGVPHYQFNQLDINIIEFNQISYPKKKLLEIFTLNELEPAMQITPKSQTRITDLSEEGDKK